MLPRPDVTPEPAASRPARRVSVVIPVKDDEACLTRCLKALAAQTRRPDEVLVVDNGSSDGSAAVARRAGARVVACTSPGIPAASARGYDRASGELILRLDADCLPASTWVETVEAAFERRPDVAAFTGGARFVDGPRLLRAPLALAYLAAYVIATAPALGHLPLFGSNLAMRREAWRSVAGAVHRDDPELHDDLDLAFHLGTRHRIRLVSGAGMGMSMRPFRSVEGVVRRVRRGCRTVTVHWPWQFPPLRWLRLAWTVRSEAPDGRARALPRTGPGRCAAQWAGATPIRRAGSGTRPCATTVRGA